jgi:fused signal recognition particle receptor
MKTFLAAFTVAVWMMLTIGSPVGATGNADAQSKELKAAAERILQTANKIREDIKHAHERRVRLLKEQEEARAQEAALKREREKKLTAEIAAARNAAERKAREAALERGRHEAAIHEEKAERVRNAQLAEAKAGEDNLFEEQKRIEKIIEEYRKQGLLGGEIKYGVDL